MMNLTSREQTLTFELMDALSSSLELPEVFSHTQDVLTRLLSADSLALCVSKPGRPTDYEWLVTEEQLAFFNAYPEMAGEDFVREAVVRRPNVVLRDSEMVPREVLVNSRMYWRFRELGMPREHAMAVLLDVDPRWHGGLTLYRERRRAFSPREQALLQRLTPALASTVRNCRMLGEASSRSHLLDTLFENQGEGMVVLEPPATELMRTPLATRLLERWFPRSERARSGLPREILERLAALVAQGEGAGLGTDSWVHQGEHENLKVTLVRLPPLQGKRPWAVVLQERPRIIPLPAEWRRRLSAREAEVVEGVLRGWDNELIADELKIAQGTVKKHLQRIFTVLGVDSRAMLIYLAAILS